MVFALCITMPSFAAEKLVVETVQKITIKKDKSGADYALIWVDQNKTMNGIKYKKSFPIMAFQGQAAVAKHLKKGETVTMIVETGTFNGHETMTLLGIKK
jgi:hypothetical protein